MGPIDTETNPTWAGMVPGLADDPTPEAFSIISKGCPAKKLEHHLDAHYGPWQDPNPGLALSSPANSPAAKSLLHLSVWR